MKPRPLASAAATAALVLGVPALLPSPAAAASGAYVALGDSYAAGVGAGDYDPASGDCRRSAVAHPALWAEAHDPASFEFTACSGARTQDVLASQLGPLDRETALVSVTAGGNDAGFADTIQTCVLRGTDACLTALAAADEYIRAALPAALDALYAEIVERAPNAEVAVLGYPHLYELDGGCLLGISEESRAVINATADLLNETIAKRAADHGFAFGDVRPAFDGHEICSSDEWLHSVTLPVGDSYHPTAEGQAEGYYPVLDAVA
ncbi:SGNH/GDSL hydrolase family protein [Streptomyces sp. DSM 44917]|uniref:SGNH/GDSL hydrolase family protein n=1 Tax=Streptomyces boetiae TaxID=3075541 RepID=A0ABU2LB33_9ACTN|nr:SGNH/GDSL hydrolase family protein [Streptomyces sp. DSM 44917]MDT0308700.1 SGNH/GDSL hydrolase family protein [Streptomyces sp. DSM 44917]